MFFYYTVFVLIVFGCTIKDKISRTGIFIEILFFFFIFSFIRWNMGTDWDAYYTIFQNMLVEGSYREIGFTYINRLVRTFTDRFTILLCIEAIILYLCIAKPLFKISIYPLLSLLAFFCLNRGNMFFVRITISVSITMLSTFCLLKNHKYRAFIYWVLALSFHTAAIAYFPIFFLYKREISIKKTIYLIIVSLIISIFFDKIITLFAGAKANLIIHFLVYAQDSKSTFGYGGGASKIFLLIRSLISRSFLLILLIYLKQKQHEHDAKFELIYTFYIVGFCIYIIVAPISFALSRLTDYYTIMEIFIYPYFLKISKKNYIKIPLLLLIFVYLGIRLYTGIHGYYECFVPISTIFNYK